MVRAGDEARVRKLQAEGLSQREIERRTGISRRTIQRMLQRSAQAPASAVAVHPGVSPVLLKGVPEVHIDIQLLQELGALWPDLQDLVAEWRARKAIRRGPYDASRETQLKTYHVEKRHIDRIATYAKEMGLKQSEVVNEAFRQFFERQ
jgi:hypothetical protein